MRVKLSTEAKAQLRELDAWWRANRRAAPDLFANELEEALATLDRTPTVGTRYETRSEFRRLLLPRTRHHLYFVERDGALHVIAVWGAARGRGPRL